ncbi:MAG TPA: YfiR family protein [Spongiibacteraceae bacterium]|nr:YfiR family protein [Spongiibacteraceae bacterium]
MRNGHIARILLSLLALLALAARAGGEDISREYRIKAAYLYNLGKFITWPGEDEMPKDAPITLCVYGYNPFENYLDKLQERQIRGRPIAVRYVKESDSVAGCQLLFISQLNTTLPKVLGAPPPYPPILTVSDDQDFLNRGGQVSLITVSNNIQLDINLTRAKQAGFSVSANLLEIAHRIQ